MHNTIVIFQDYGKPSSFIITTNPIARFAASPHTYYFLVYLLVVRPTMIILSNILYGSVVASAYQSEWMVRKAIKYTADRFSQDLKKEFIDMCKIELDVSSYRHVAVYFAKHLTSNVERNSGLETLHTSAGHSEKTALRTYARDDGLFASDREDLYEDFRMGSLRWHQFLNILPDSPKSNPTRIADILTVEAGSNITVNEQSISAQKFGKVDIRVQIDVRGNTATEKYSLLQEYNPKYAYDAQKGLRLLGYEEWLSDHQAKSMEMVCAGTTDLLIILPTGHGKSLCFLIPAKLNPLYKNSNTW